MKSSGEQTTPGEANVDGVRIAYESSGTGPALVCCHAFAVDRSMWEPQRERFAQTHQLITFDQRGSGDSDHPELLAGAADPYTLDTFAEDLRAVLDAAGIEKARILGFSMGAATALRFAIRWPERVDKLVLASAMASRLPAPIIERARKVEKILEDDGLEAAYRFYFGGSLFDGVAKSGGLGPILSDAASRATPHGFSGCYRVTIDRPSVADDLHRISARTVILVGEHDVHYHADAELMAERIPNAHRVMVPGVGHAMSIEAPELFAREVLQFLDGE